MKYSFVTYPTFDREFKRLLKRYKSMREDLLALVADIEKGAGAGTDLGHGLFKYRLAISAKGKGKRGGGRAITLNVVVSEDETEVGFLYIYDKSEQVNVTDDELKRLMRKNGLG